jgi:hypothetical protein
MGVLKLRLGSSILGATRHAMCILLVNYRMAMRDVVRVERNRVERRSRRLFLKACFRYTRRRTSRSVLMTYSTVKILR